MKQAQAGMDAAYLLSDIDFRVGRLKFAIVLALVAMPVFIIVDFILYPADAIELFRIRLWFEGVCLLIFAFSYTRWGKLRVKALGVVAAVTPALAISWMIMSTDGSASPYYAGLSLVVVAASMILPWTLTETLIVCGVTYAFYFLATILNPYYVVGGEFNWPVFVNNLFFLTSSIIFCIISSQYHSNRRKKLFALNYEIGQQYKTLKDTQSKLLQSEKLNALGSMSAGLLHEINNPLNYTTTALQLLRLEPAVTADAEIMDTVNDIDEGMARVRTIVSDLRAFAYPSDIQQHSVFSIKSAIEKSLRFTRADLIEVAVEINLDDSDHVVGSESHVVQVIVNLLSNAARATKAAGKEQQNIIMSSHLEGGRLVVCVQDNGVGMSEETLNKVFDPFFTTQAVGDGMGLGLSICHTIIQNHDGELSASSTVGEGTTFQFDLAIAKQAERSEAKEADHAEKFA